MFQLANRTIIIASSLFASACGTQSDKLAETENAQITVTSLAHARDALSANADIHTTQVMAQSQLSDITVHELGFHNISFAGLDEIQWHLDSLAACWNDEGESLDRADAFNALAGLRVEMRAHQIGMITMVDADTALVAEQVFHRRQQALLTELENSVLSLVPQAEAYQCTY